jgi:hypothetical protein
LLKRRSFLALGSASALVSAREARAAFQIFNARSTAISSGQIASIPLGSFAAEFNQSGFTEANGDGTTGYNSGGSWTILQYWFNFPYDQYYQFVVPAWCSSFTAIPANSLMVYIDQLMTPASTGNTVNKNWWGGFVSNVAPSQNYTFSSPVKAGWHSIQIFFNTNAYYGTGALNNSVHGDRLNIIATGTVLPAEPAGSRSPADFPMSSYHFINTPFGANATWLALNNPIAQTVNGTGGNGAFVAVHSITDSQIYWKSDSGSPVFSVSTNDPAQFPTPSVSLNYPVRAPAGIYSAFGGDNPMTLVDMTNPRFSYVGFGAGTIARTASYYRMGVQDSYNLNHASPQSLAGGCGTVRVADFDSGAIQHRLLGALGFTSGGASSGYGPAAQTSNFAGMPWPGSESDYNWSSQYLNPNGVPYASVIGIPPSVTRPGGMNAGTAMMWDAMQNYGMFLNVTGGTYPNIVLYVESATFNHPRLNEINWSTILPNLSVMSNPQPIVIGQGFGGGSPRVPLLPGLQQGYPSLGLAPYTPPASPLGVPIQVAPRCGSSSDPSGSPSTNTAAINVPVGSSVFIMIRTDANTVTASWTSCVDSAGNIYTVVQPTYNGTTNGLALAYCLNIPHAIVAGTTTWTAIESAHQSFWSLAGMFYRPQPLAGSTSLRTSGSAITGSSVTTLSTTLTGVQVGDLIIGYTATSNYAEITEPAGFSSLMNIPPLTISYQVATSSGTVTYNPAWNNASPAVLAVAVFANANGDANVMGPLTVSAANSRYFATPNGTPVYLNGSHEWANRQDIQPAGSTQVFDFNAYVTFLQTHNHSCIRLWVSENTKQSFPGYTNELITPYWAYQRNGPGNANDGLPKFDLTQFNQSWFDRVRTRVMAARAAGIYVSIMLFNGWSVDNKGVSGYDPWSVHPYNVANNINGVNGDPSSTGQGLKTQDLSIPTITGLQHTYVQKLIDTVNDLDNVLYEVANEADSTSTAWQENIIAFVRTYEAGKPFRHPIGFTPQTNAGTDIVEASDADWFAPTDTPVDWFYTPQPATGDKVCVADTDHIFGTGGNALWVWQAFLLGSNVWYMDSLIGLGITPPLVSPQPADELSGRLGIGQTGRYARRLNLANVVPSGSLSSTGWCMAWIGNQYIVLRTATSGAFTVDLSGASGKTFNVEWLNVNADTATSSGTVAGGSATQSFTAPFNDVAVLFLF